jgi:acyl carrier protein
MYMTDRLFELFSSVLGIEPDRLNDKTSPANTSAWDSTSNIMLITEIEAQFEIELSTTDIESMGDIGRVRHILQQHGVPGL